MKLLLKPYNTYSKPSFETTFLDENVKNLITQKVATFLGYFIFSKNHNEIPKVAQYMKSHPIWSTWDQCYKTFFVRNLHIFAIV
jgi:hypothetical protein